MIPSPDKMIEDDMESFIRSLAQRAGEGYTVEQIAKWILESMQKHGIGISRGRLIKSINDPQGGIKAVTDRNRKEG
jgi:hypothetical protein